MHIIVPHMVWLGAAVLTIDKYLLSEVIDSRPQISENSIIGWPNRRSDSLRLQLKEALWTILPRRRAADRPPRQARRVAHRRRRRDAAAPGQRRHGCQYPSSPDFRSGLSGSVGYCGDRRSPALASAGGVAAEVCGASPVGSATPRERCRTRHAGRRGAPWAFLQ